MGRAVSYRSIVLRGLGAGVGFGVLYGLLRGSAWVGVIGGLVFGTTMAAVMRRQWGLPSLAALDHRERRTVARALRRGEPVDDPRLAVALQDQAAAILATPYRVTAIRLVGGLFALFGALVGVLALRDGNWAGAAGGLLMLAFALALVFFAVPFGLRQRARVARSAEETRARLTR